MSNKRRNLLFFISILVLCIALLISIFLTHINGVTLSFNADRAWTHVLAQMQFGPRTPGSVAHQEALVYIQRELKKAGWSVETQQTSRMGHSVENIIAKRGSGSPWIILGAHYDSRMFADQDPDITNRSLPVPGADDGASGVAVLLEIARDLPRNLDKQVWLVFFDTEDQGDIQGWDWLLGSEAFAESLTTKPDAVVVVDMIGDKDLNIYREQSSTQGLTDAIWATAAKLGYGKQFINQEKYNMLDDQTPFLQAGIPAVDIIDFDYPYWHTTQDVTDKISKDSLTVVGDTLLAWLKDQKGHQ